MSPSVDTPPLARKFAVPLYAAVILRFCTGVPPGSAYVAVARPAVIALVTAGWLIVQAIASCTSGIPASSASLPSASAASSLRWFAGIERSKRCGSRSARVLDGWPAPSRQRPDSQPPPSGLHGITPIP